MNELLLVMIPAVALYTGNPVMLPYVAYKLWVFAALVAAGLMIRVKLGLLVNTAFGLQLI